MPKLHKEQEHLQLNLSSPLVECIPNISTANQQILDSIAKKGRLTPEFHLLDIDASPGLGRTVLTWAGSLNSTFLLLKYIAQLLATSFDIRTYDSDHPHVGALDVCPIVPLFNSDLPSILKHTRAFAKEFASVFDLPIFFYGKLVDDKTRAYSLHTVRNGGPSGLSERLLNSLHPHAGPRRMHKRLGATLVGVRSIMTAYNINLSTADLTQARKLASLVRSGLPVKAMAWYSQDFKRIQLSMNIYGNSISLPELFDKISILASSLDISCSGSEVIGLVSRKALSIPPMAFGKDLAHSLQPIERLGLDEVKPFTVEHHLLEDRINNLWQVWPDI